MIGLIVFGMLAFILASGLVARVLTADSDERSAAVDIIKTQVDGNASAVIARIEGCAARPACRAQVRRDVARLRGPKPFKVLNVRSPGFSLGGRTAITRV